VVTGLVVLVVVVVLATGAGLTLRRRQGRFTTLARTNPRSIIGDSPASPFPATSADALTADDLGAPLGERATLVQFSTEFCANCPGTRRLLTQVVGERDGISFVEVDAAARLDLTRRLNVLATPTVLVLGPDGAIASRATGAPRKADVLAAVDGVLAAGAAGIAPSRSEA
jgi:thiol-disulfide isomerase/thioredoxin